MLHGNHIKLTYLVTYIQYLITYRAGFRGAQGPWPRAPTGRGPHQNKCID